MPILIGPMEKTFLVWRELFDAGVFTNPVVRLLLCPKVAGRLLRTSYMATHTDEQLGLRARTDSNGSERSMVSSGRESR